MEKFDYYTAPSDEVFEVIKSCAVEIWRSYDNTYGYVDEKIGRIKDLKNIRDNCTFIVAMFDIHNQRKLFQLVKDKNERDAEAWLSDYYYF